MSDKRDGVAPATPAFFNSAIVQESDQSIDLPGCLGWRGTGDAQQLVGERARVVQLAQRLDHPGAVHGDGAVGVGVEDDVADQALDVAVEDEARRARPSRLMTGEPELPPMMSQSETKLSGVERFSLVAPVDVALRAG